MNTSSDNPTVASLFRLGVFFTTLLVLALTVPNAFAGNPDDETMKNTGDLTGTDHDATILDGSIDSPTVDQYDSADPCLVDQKYGVDKNGELCNPDPCVDKNGTDLCDKYPEDPKNPEPPVVEDPVDECDDTIEVIDICAADPDGNPDQDLPATSIFDDPELEFGGGETPTLAATASGARGGGLPFTGLELGSVFGIGFGLVLTGLIIHSLTRTKPE